MTPPLVLGLLLVAWPTVATDSDCPSAMDVESTLRVLLRDDNLQAGAVEVKTTPNGLIIELRPDDRDLGAQRALAVVGTCKERARAVAVVIATWWPAKPAHEVEPILESAARPEAVATKKLSRPLSLIAGGFASLVSGSASAGARVEALWLPWLGSIGPRLALSGTGPHGGDLGDGQARFTRAAAELGMAYADRWLSLDASVLASLFWVEGSGFSERNQTATGFAAGATMGARVGWPVGRLQPWIGLRGLMWPQSQRLYVLDLSTDIQTSRAMPHWEFQLGAGVAFSVF